MKTTLSRHASLTIEPLQLLLTFNLSAQHRRRRPFGREWIQKLETGAVRVFKWVMVIWAVSLVPYAFGLMPSWYEVPLQIIYTMFFEDTSLSR